ncbi:MAG: hypothetical protein FJW96_05735 [Actinobacteria bacterium]|nr:hypothetical protein [Actinomycetota bacterium]
MTNHENDDLMRDLQDLLGRADPVPDAVVEAGKAAYGWRTIDADLAELLADSIVDKQPAGVRSSGTGPRIVTFESEGLTIDIEVRKERRAHRLLGQIDPPGSVTVTVELDDGAVAATTTSDELGRFELRFDEGARIRLRVDAPAAASVVSAWLPL